MRVRMAWHTEDIMKVTSTEKLLRTKTSTQKVSASDRAAGLFRSIASVLSGFSKEPWSGPGTVRGRVRAGARARVRVRVGIG